MLETILTKKFKQDYMLMGKRRKNLDKIDEIIAMITLQEKLPERCREHILSGNWEGLWECHVEPDWLLIYDINYITKEVTFERTGTHSDLF